MGGREGLAIAGKWVTASGWTQPDDNFQTCLQTRRRDSCVRWGVTGPTAADVGNLQVYAQLAWCSHSTDGEGGGGPHRETKRVQEVKVDTSCEPGFKCDFPICQAHRFAFSNRGVAGVPLMSSLQALKRNSGVFSLPRNFTQWFPSTLLFSSSALKKKKKNTI